MLLEWYWEQESSLVLGQLVPEFLAMEVILTLIGIAISLHLVTNTISWFHMNDTHALYLIFYFRIRVICGLMVIYRQWTLSAISKRAQIHQSFVMDIKPTSSSAGLDAQLCSSHSLSDKMQETLTGFGNIDQYCEEVKGSQWGREGLS